MASIESSLKYESGVEPGKVRLITSDMGGSRSIATAGIISNERVRY